MLTSIACILTDIVKDYVDRGRVTIVLTSNTNHFNQSNSQKLSSYYYTLA